MKKGSVLIVDDEPEMCFSLEELFRDEGFFSDSASSPLLALEKLKQYDYSLILMDIRMPEMGGMDLLQRVRRSYSQIPVVMITGYPTVDTAVRAMKYGAVNYYTKPLNLNALLNEAKQLTEKIDDALEKSPKEMQQAIVASDLSMERIRWTIQRAGEVDAPVLIHGESGTGKELIAQAIHDSSDRAKKPFVRVNCAAIPDSLIESELFGHEAGAFTDAKKQRKGKFEMADGGTLFLDEIGDMSLPTQASILHALQEKTFERLGGSTSIQSDCRIIAATHKDLWAKIESGDFREDLFYRLAVITVEVPPLRDRNRDIELLANHFMHFFNQRYSRSVSSIGQDVLSLFYQHEWPGNVRELKNCIERAVIFAEGDSLTVQDLPSQYHHSYGKTIVRQKRSEIHKLNQEMIQDALQQCGGVKTKAADLLKISRRTLYYRMKRLGMDP